MKKTILIALAVLLALMAVTCDSFAPEAANEPAGYTEDGRPTYWLKINAPQLNRALTLDLAKNNVTYYEVAFKDQAGGSTKVYRTSWNYTQTGRIAIPAGTYTGAANAVLFAGRQSDKTLLAVGVITAVDGTGGTTISPTTSNVTFTLSALTNDVSAIPIDVDEDPPGTAVNLTASTFQITGPTGGAHNYATSAYTKTTTNNYKDFPMVEMEVDHKKYPLYRVPKDSAAITATYRVDCGTANANYTGVIIAAAGELFSGPATNKSYGVVVTGTVLPDSITAIPPAGVAVPSSGIFDITIDTTGPSVTDGLSQISIKVPVCAISITNDYPGTWYIRGGLDQSALDQGIKANTIGSLGGAVLLGVGAVEETGIEIKTGW